MKVIEQEALQELGLLQTVKKYVFSLEVPSAESRFFNEVSVALAEAAVTDHPTVPTAWCTCVRELHLVCFAWGPFCSELSGKQKAGETTGNIGWGFLSGQGEGEGGRQHAACCDRCSPSQEILLQGGRSLCK